MKVLLAGASGAIGMPLIKHLHLAGHEVIAICRSSPGRDRLAAVGVSPVQVDVLDRAGLLSALAGQRADAVISELTALKKTPLTHRDMAATNRLRTEGTANLVAAARQLRARRFLTQSMVFGYGYGDWAGQTLTEADPFGPPGRGRFERHVAAMRVNEQQVFGSGLDGIALRYGLLYGPGPASEAMIDGLRQRRLPVVKNSGVQPWVYVDDAAAVTAAALEHGQPGAAYDITDCEPVSLVTMLTALAEAIGAPAPRTVPRWLLAATPYARAVITGGLRVSNARAVAELGWTLRAPTYREGMRLFGPQSADRRSPAG
jgi:nucleoside-diphosphate-sugar epimerase